MHSSLSRSLLICLILVVGSRETGLASYAHNPVTYPDSLVDFGWCRLTEPSLVCDPDSVLNSKNEVDGVLMLHYAAQRVLFHTNCSCTREDRQFGFCEQKSRGYVISVAVLKKIAGPTDDGTDKSKELIEVFSRVLHKRLKRGQCEDDVLIVFSLEDDLLYTILGVIARRKLNSQVVKQVEQLARMMHINNMDFTSGLVLMINIYGRVLAGENYLEALPPINEAGYTNGLKKMFPKWPQWIILTLLIGIPVCVTIFVILFALIFSLRRYYRRQGSGYTAGQQQTS